MAADEFRFNRLEGGSDRQIGEIGKRFARTVMVDREGNMRYIHHGYQPGYENEYQTQIRALLRE